MCSWQQNHLSLRRLLLIVGATLSLMAQHALANTEARLALLIGNANYRSSPLANPVNDVRLMETALKEAGFTVLKAENASIRDMRRLVRDFGDRLKASGGVGLFYFAGHGVQVRGDNFLVSTDSDIRNEDEIADDAINANVILEKMQNAGNRMNLIILDACRNNPFASKSRSAQSGLATMSAPSGSLVAYSTAPGSVASDGTGNNGLYTEHLARALREPGLPVEEVFKQVRAAVRKASNNQQTPWENTALEGQFFFKASPQPAAPLRTSLPSAVSPLALAPGPGNAAGSDQVALELALWDAVKNSQRISELQAYVTEFPNGTFARLAKGRMEQLQLNAAPAAAATVPAEPAAKTPAAAAPVQVAPAIALTAAERPPAAQVTAMAPITAVPIAAPARPPPLAPASVPQAPAAVAPRPGQAPAAAGMQAGPVQVVRPEQQPDVGATPVLRVSAPGAAIGTLVLTDSLTRIKRDMAVSVQAVDALGTAYSSGDIIGLDGQVQQVRVGEAVLRRMAGALWSVPLRSGTSGAAIIKRMDGNYPSSGTLTWKAVAGAQDKVQLEALVGYRELGSNAIDLPVSGKWIASYGAATPLPESFSAEIRGSSYTSKNMTTGALKLGEVSGTRDSTGADAPGSAGAPAERVVGTLVLTDTLTKIKRDFAVSAQASVEGQTTYSTGDVIDRDGKVLQVRIGETVMRLVSGALWSIPVAAGTSGDARLKRIDVNYAASGMLNWKAVDIGQGKVRIDAQVSYQVMGRSDVITATGRWSAVYGIGQFLPESDSTSVRGTSQQGISLVAAEFTAR